MYNMFTEYWLLAVSNPELYEYVDNHWAAAAEGDFPIAALVDESGAVSDERSLSDIAAALSDAVSRIAEIGAQQVVRLAGVNGQQALESGKPLCHAAVAQMT
ncbi:MAG TPA: hypothetical protein VGJ59_02010 [Jatrophihabitantaceae bacterium]|jgi:hypothetical protein